VAQIAFVDRDRSGGTSRCDALTVTRLENGRGTTLETVERIARVLGSLELVTHAVSP
jgi:hypothetical protein